MSPPPIKWGDILLLALLSVLPSLRPSVCLFVRSISFEPIVGFTNNSAPMSSLM